jgi:septal ring factor EnvC (AmiA/AmiB activator)
MVEQNQDQEGERSTLEVVGQAFAVLILVLLAVGIVFAVIGIYPHKLPTEKNPSFVDTIFASRVVILAARITLMFVAAYIAVSIVGLIASRRWLSQLGPFKASETIARLDHSAEALENDLQDAANTIHDLEQRLVESDEDLTKAQADIEFLLDHIDTIEAQQGGS